MVVTSSREQSLRRALFEAGLDLKALNALAKDVKREGQLDPWRRTYLLREIQDRIWLLEYCEKQPTQDRLLALGLSLVRNRSHSQAIGSRS
jgi:hypothetical protein